MLNSPRSFVDCARSLAAETAGQSPSRQRLSRASIGPSGRPPKMWTWRCGTSWPRVAADIGEQPVARVDQPRLARDLADGADEPGDLRLRSHGGEIVPRDVGALGDDQDVDRGQRIDVVEGERMLVLIDLLATGSRRAGSARRCCRRRRAGSRSIGMRATVAFDERRVKRNCATAWAARISRAMASLAPRPSLFGWLFEPLRRPGAGRLRHSSSGLPARLTATAIERLLTGEMSRRGRGSLIWSAVAVVPWFALFEWSKQRAGVEAMRRPALLVALVLGIAALSRSRSNIWSTSASAT